MCFKAVFSVRAHTTRIYEGQTCLRAFIAVIAFIMARTSCAYDAERCCLLESFDSSLSTAFSARNLPFSSSNCSTL